MNEAPAPWWKCIVAALPDLLLGTQFWLLAYSPKQFGARPSDYTSIMQAEFLVIHSMAFLGWLALWKPEDRDAKMIRGLVFWLLFLFYCAMAGGQGWRQFFIYILLTFVTYLGLFMNWRSPSALLQLGARWAAGFAVFVAALGIFGAPKNAENWAGLASVIKAGAMYFLVMGTLEISGLFLRVVPRNAENIYDALRRGSKR